jgi:CHAD domain-containing protein
MEQQIDDSFRMMAASYFRKQLRQLRRQFDGIRRAVDAEPIHQARVASRRLRAALRVFEGCFPADAINRWKREIRRVTRGLGAARDRDVQIEWLCGVLRAAPEASYGPGLARVLVRLQRKRDRRQSRVLAVLEGVEQSGVLAEMRDSARRVLSDARQQQTVAFPAAAAARLAPPLVEAIDRLLEFQTCLSDPNDRQRHHAMRIAAKRLRYTMEIGRPAYGCSLDGPIAAMKRLQTLLGEIHDADVWIDYLGKVIDKERRRIVRRYGSEGPFRRVEAGIAWLGQECRGRRERLFAEVAALWQEWARQNYWDELLLAVRAAEAGPPETHPPQPDDQHGRAAAGEPREVEPMLCYGAH